MEYLRLRNGPEYQAALRREQERGTEPAPARGGPPVLLDVGLGAVLADRQIQHRQAGGRILACLSM